MVKVIPPVNCVIQLTKHSQPKVVHMDKLKAWNGDPPPSWLEPSEPVREDHVVESEAVEVDERQGVATEPQAPTEQAIDPDTGSDDSSHRKVVGPVRPARERRPPRRLADYVA